VRAKLGTATAERISKSRTQELRLSAVSGEGQEPLAPALDRLIHERMRLGIVSALAVNPSLTFNELKALLRTTDGNLSVHARKLEEAAYINCTKMFDGRLWRLANHLRIGDCPEVRRLSALKNCA